MTNDEVMIVALVTALGLPVILGAIYVSRSVILKKI